MGCGGSKGSASEREAVTSKFSPLLRRRFEEIKGRSKAAEKGTLSKKELLKEVLHEDDHSASHSDHGDDNGRKSVSSPEETLRAAKVKPEPEPFEHENNKVEKKEDKTLVEKTTKKEKKGESEEEGEDEEEDRLSDVENEYLCPGSPSFRVYIEPLKNNKDDSKDDDTSEKSQVDNNGEIVESVTSNEESEMKIKEKGKRGRRFRRVMGRGKPAAVKSLLNVTSCYNPSNSRYDKARLLAEKPAA